MYWGELIYLVTVSSDCWLSFLKGPTCSKWKTSKQKKNIRDILSTQTGCAKVPFKARVGQIADVWASAPDELGNETQGSKYLTSRSFNRSWYCVAAPLWSTLRAIFTLQSWRNPLMPHFLNLSQSLYFTSARSLKLRCPHWGEYSKCHAYFP